MAVLGLAFGAQSLRYGAVPENIINWKVTARGSFCPRAEAPDSRKNRRRLKQTARSSTEQVQTAGGVDFLFAYYCAASSILVAVNSNLPSTSLTVPVAVTFLDSLQSLPWNSLLTSLATKK